MQAKGRAIILMMDSFGIGGAKDAALFGDEGSNTFLHIAENYKNLKVPNLKKLGLVEQRQGHFFRALGNGGRAGNFQLGLF